MPTQRGHEGDGLLAFIDETSANTKMVRLHGRCARGERRVGHVPQGQPGRVKHALFSHPAPPCARHVRAFLLRRPQSFF